MAVTARAGLRYPVLADTADVPRDVKNLADDVDAKMAIDSQGLLSARPTTGLVQGQYYFATDNNLIYRYNGSAWITLNAAGAVDAAAGVGSLRTLGTGALQAAAGNDPRFAPGTVDGPVGTGTLRTLGTGAQQAMPGNDARVAQPGDLKMSVGITLLTGWLACDGASYLRATYPALFTELGGASSTWGLPDGTHFNVPDFRSRSPMGAGQGTGLTNRVFGTYLGAETVTLSVTEIPSHNHGGVTGNESASHIHSVSLPGVLTSAHGSTLVGAGGTSAFYDDVGTGTTVNTGPNTTNHTHTVALQGGGGAHANVHPVAIVKFQVKT